MNRSYCCMNSIASIMAPPFVNPGTIVQTTSAAKLAHVAPLVGLTNHFRNAGNKQDYSKNGIPPSRSMRMTGLLSQQHRFSVGLSTHRICILSRCCCCCQPGWRRRSSQYIQALAARSDFPLGQPQRELAIGVVPRIV